MSRFARRRAGHRSFDEVETALREYFTLSTPDMSGIDFRKMAKTAIHSDNAPIRPLSLRLRRSRYAVRTLLLRFGCVAGACALALGLMRVTFYFAPNWEQVAYAAIRSIPGSQFVISPRDAGMLELAKRGLIQAMDISASDQGISVHVLGAYADGLRTVLFLRVDAPSTGADSVGTWTPSMQNLVLTDQFGHRYTLRGGRWDIGAHEGNVEFDGIAPWKLALGVRLRLHIQTVEWIPEPTPGSITPPSRFRDLNGSWTLDWVQTSLGQEKSVAVNSSATSNGLQIRLKSVVLSPSATQLTFSSVEEAGAAYGSNAGDGGAAVKPPARDSIYVEREATGERFPILSGGTITYGRDVTERIVTTPLPQPGNYVLVITRFNGLNGRWELPFTIP